MQYYVALSWNALDRGACEEARALLDRFRSCSNEWRMEASQEGFAFLLRAAGSGPPDRLYVLPNGRGVVFGRLFERRYAWELDSRSAAPADIAMDERRAAAMLASKGRDLISQYWGRYVAFLRDASRNATWVLRDPTGAIPCESTRIGRVHVHFVRLEDCERLGMPPRAINRHYLLGYLLYDSVCVRETGLDGIETVLAGECVAHLGDATTRSFYWNPLQVAQVDAIEDSNEATDLMRQVVRGCVHAWASCFDGALLELSGGLDSSIVLACLVNTPTPLRLVCRHNYSRSSDLDERPVARLAARHSHSRLLEHEVDPQFDFPPLSNARRCLSPFPQLFDLEAQRRYIQLMHAEGLGVQFTGDGGDELFHRGGCLPTSVDYAWRHGLDSRLFSTVIDDAVYSRRSFWQTLRTVLAFGVRRRRWSLRDLVTGNAMSLVPGEVVQAAALDDAHWHPLFRGSSPIEPCKFTQAYLLAFSAARGFVPSSSEDQPEFMTPLMSQPLMELSLRIPVYVLMTGGRDRALARQAFAGDIAPQILRRRAKGYADSFTRDVLWSHIRLVRELLLDGFLVSNGLLDRRKVEDLLSGNPTRLEASIMDLASCLDVEVWIQSATAGDARAAA